MTATTLRNRLLRPTLPGLWAFLAIALPAIAGLGASLPTVDLTHHLRAGADILAGRGIPTVDSWTFTAAGSTWLDQQWGAQVLLAAIFSTTGWVGLAIVRAGLLALASGLIFVAIRRRAPGIGLRSAALLALAAFVVTAPAMALRPQLLGVVLLAGFLVVLSGRHDRPRGLWMLPILAVLWANLHGSFVLAPAIVGLAWLEDLVAARYALRAPAARRMFAVTIATAAATLITPFGLGAWRYALGLATSREVTARISEWQPPGLADPAGILFWGSALAAGAAVLLISRRRGALPAWPGLVTLAAFAGLAALAARGIAWWPAVAVVTLAGMAGPEAAPAPAARATRGSALNAVIAATLVIAGVLLVPIWRPLDPALGAPAGLLSHAPAGLTARLREMAGPSDRVWNPQVWGSWFEFAVPVPAYALDSRIELIPPAAWSDADIVARGGDGWEAILGRRGVTILVTTSDQGGLVDQLHRSGSWQPAYGDADGALWILQASLYPR